MKYDVESSGQQANMMNYWALLEEGKSNGLAKLQEVPNKRKLSYGLQCPAEGGEGGWEDYKGRT